MPNAMTSTEAAVLINEQETLHHRREVRLYTTGADSHLHVGEEEATQARKGGLQSYTQIWHRPNLYIGTKQSKTGSLFGVAWMLNQGRTGLRHDASDDDGLQRWGFMRNDGQGFWQQQFIDPNHKLKLQADMHCLNPEDFSTSCSFRNHASWQLDINGTIHGSKRFKNSRQSKSMKASVLFYMSGGENQTMSMKLFDTKSSADKSSSLPGIRGHAVLVGGETSEQEALVILNPPAKSHPSNGRTLHSTQAPLAERESRENLVNKAPELMNIHYYLTGFQTYNYWQLGGHMGQLLQASHQKTVYRHYQLEKVAAADRGEEINPFHLQKASEAGVVPLLPGYIGNGSIHQGMLQLVLKPPFNIRVLHCSQEMIRAAGMEKIDSENDAAKLVEFIQAQQTEETVTERRSKAISSFDNRFNETIVKGSVWAGKKDVYQALHNALSQVVGCVTHYRGSLLVDRRDPSQRGSEGEHASSVLTTDGRVAEEGAIVHSREYELITGMPSRSIFPRGFLWDEGFHQLLVSEWDKMLSKTVIESWFSTMDSDGWIPREQTMGEEAQSRVPAKFRVQRPDIANPPTLLLAIEKLIGLDADSGSTNAELSSDDRAWLSRIHPKLVKWMYWYLNTQYTPRGEEGDLRWAGASPNHTFASGIDDFPRGVVPTEYDVHVDLMSWLIWGIDLLDKIAAKIDRQDSLIELKEKRNKIRERLEKLWNSDHNWFCDYGAQYADSDEATKIGDTCHKGYIGLFPLALGIMSPDDTRLESVLNVLRDESELWSPFGIRSLSKQDGAYRTHEDYWRGKIWVNLNYLIWRGLRYYAHNERTSSQLKSQLFDVAEELRTNLVGNVVQQFQESGFLWENFDPDNGRGTGTHPFTGWTGALLPLLVR
eukprot:gb/GECG01002107.1/.p1 GENE.gb/GECG01002107.1/~~gb/GECG01002107.1/.p1  ORF type:complete len:881 (+),score=113.18 gb/GECG01002107.1/:1-2643(+)